ncbi:hypothetical protein [Micromonospora coxensis]|uniref:hypothetical protein n=1 Tax=Micromonospora coxensis TaxID=356852 RepID=UPI001E2953C7|nr:hypothetical protein [Micromonospora coxensis]
MPTEPNRCAGALIVDDDGRLSVQRRPAERRLSPIARDVVGSSPRVASAATTTPSAGRLGPGEGLDHGQPGQAFAAPRSIGL